MTGRTIREAPVELLHPAGSHCSFTAKNSTRTGATTNTGIDMPVIENAMTVRSR